MVSQTTVPEVYVQEEEGGSPPEQLEEETVAEPAGTIQEQGVVTPEQLEGETATERAEGVREEGGETEADEQHAPEEDLAETPVEIQETAEQRRSKRSKKQTQFFGDRLPQWKTLASCSSVHVYALISNYCRN